MRKLLFLLPFTAGLALAKPPTRSNTAVLTIPKGAKALVIHLDGSTYRNSLIGASSPLTINMVVTPDGARFTYIIKMAHHTITDAGNLPVNLTFQPFTERSRAYRPALNTWTGLPLGTARGRLRITKDSTGWHKVSNDITLDILFTGKDLMHVPTDLAPPARP